MSLVICNITEGPLPSTAPHGPLLVPDPNIPADPAAATDRHAGAQVVFCGVVRPTETDGSITGLNYETYDPMTQQELEKLAHQLADKHQLLGIIVEHSRGFVAAGQVSFRLSVAAERRKAALHATDEFIDTMKQRVPIWKVPVWSP